MPGITGPGTRYIRVQGMSPAGFRSAFARGLNRTMAGIKNFHKAGISVKIFLREGSKWKYIYSRASVEKALLQQGINPNLVSDALSVFSAVTLLQMYGEGRVLEELHLARIPMITNPEAFSAKTDHDKIRTLEELGVIAVMRRTEKDLQADRQRGKERITAAKKRADLEKTLSRIKHFGLFDPESIKE